MILKSKTSVKKRLNALLFYSFFPLALIIVFLLLQLNRFSQRYDQSVEHITAANAYNLNLKQTVDYTMYIIVVNSEHASELVDVSEPEKMICEAQTSFKMLGKSTSGSEKQILIRHIESTLVSLQKSVTGLQESVASGGSYDQNIETLDLDIRVLTALVQDQIQEYISLEAESLGEIREQLRGDVLNLIRITLAVFAAVLAVCFYISRRITFSIVLPVQKLVHETEKAGRGELVASSQGLVSLSEAGAPSDPCAIADAEGLSAAAAVLSERGGDEEAIAPRPLKTGCDEIEILSDSFHNMMDQIRSQIKTIQDKQKTLQDMELRLLQQQINPHFLYNTLDTIIWLAEAGDNAQVISMVSSLSSFFRTSLSGGRNIVTAAEEKEHISSYLQIQQFRYRDILTYKIDIPDEMLEYRMLKLSLQPLVENALYHGIKLKREGGRILVTGTVLPPKMPQTEGRLVFIVKDNGIGMKSEELEEARNRLSGRTAGNGNSGFGLYNVQQRIRLNFGDAYGVTIESVYREGTTVKLVLPAIRNRQNIP